MKNHLLTFLYMLLATLAFGQTVITTNTFPNIGDTLKYKSVIDINANIDMGNRFGPQVWDFRSLPAGESEEEIYLNPSDGTASMRFPQANLLLKIGEAESYLLKNNNKIVLEGLGGDNGLIDLPVTVSYSKKPIFRQAPLEIVARIESNAEFKIDLSTSILPDSLLGLFPIRPDSIRISFAQTSDGTLDAFGKLLIYDEEFEVLRESSREISKTGVLIKAFGTWLDVGAIFPGGLPGGFGDLLGTDTTQVYKFHTNQRKEILLEAEFTTSNEMVALRYWHKQGASSIKDWSRIETKISPNPTTDLVSIQVDKLIKTNYILTVCDAQGNNVFAHIGNKELDNGLIDINTTNWPAGMYLIHIVDKFNKYHGHGKILVQK